MPKIHKKEAPDIPPPRPSVKATRIERIKDDECFLLADKYARTKLRWWVCEKVPAKNMQGYRLKIKQPMELDPANNEPDKLLYERVRRRYGNA